MNEYRPGGFQILPPVIKNLIIINVLVYAATYVLQKSGIVDLNYYLALFQWNSPLFRPWQIVTHLFMHASLGHLFGNMFALWMFGNVIENALGTKRFLIFYFICGLGSVLLYSGVFYWENAANIQWFHHQTIADQYQMVQQIISSNVGDPRAFPMVSQMLGASGAIMGVLFAFGYLYPDVEIYIYFLIPIKAKYLVAIYAAFELLAGFYNSPSDQVAHFAHIGGMLFAYLLLNYWKKSRRNNNYR
jgi:membrane associated rhomboid family serine protease